MSELMQRGGDLLLLRSNLLRLAELLPETLLGREVQGVIAESEWALAGLTLAEWALAELALPELTQVAQTGIAKPGVAELLTESLMRAITAHHPTSSEHGGRQGLSEER